MGFIYALWIIPILAILIFLHELGHFVMARRSGVRVEEFGIGLPPRIWGHRHGDTIYSINAIPLGGFVRVHGEDGKSFSDDSMQTKSMGQRARFLAAGSFMNFVTAFVLVGALVAFQGRTDQNVYVTEVMPGSPAAEAGWLAGDRFVSVAGQEIDNDEQVRQITAGRAGSAIVVTLERSGQLIDTTITPRVDPPAGEGRTGIRLGSSVLADIHVREVPAQSAGDAAGFQTDDLIRSVDGVPTTDYMRYATYLAQRAGEVVTFGIERNGQLITLDGRVPESLPEETEPMGMSLARDIRFERVPLLEIPGETVRTSVTWTVRLVEGIIILITGQASFGDVAGPIGMGQLTSEIISESAMPLWVTLVTLSIILSLNLGMLNLLPLPALDGGRLMFVAIEFLRRGKRVAPEKEGLVHFVGIAILLSLMLVIAFRDVDRIFSGRSFLQ
ncbi:MAG TPA: RIP metalloprotease RseP [Thermomicrobiales bacterium]|nr:RIP metalloprotease RseP [Thermomicrobiales bacterium]